MESQMDTVPASFMELLNMVEHPITNFNQPNTENSIPEESSCYSDRPYFSEDNDVLSRPNLRVETCDYVDDSNEVESRLQCRKDTVELPDKMFMPENLDENYLFSAYNVQTEESDSNERFLEGGQVGAVENGIRSYCEDTSVQMLRPVVGMKFSSIAEAYDFYNTYSWVLGFSIRNGDNYITIRTCVQIMQEFTCQRAGFNKNTKYATTRCGCKATLRVNLN
ncbi:protein FAR1-RELATED SEQUENCE 6-like [Triticum dicoccoides]|uniref:protein FAR1-RELATED SEQUENCE 6-like n=1 Tax=Triticum dicoccoides TaxID=85692 RepID=UPI0018917DA4|nr:protein FAR1-RELATED SEQUENCE 6-like [Triticum dicoccoides]XP_037443707.1 protein FAR1-RELATED SEQUENCE 6-like [Triticum dicoccoides]